MTNRRLHTPMLQGLLFVLSLFLGGAAINNLFVTAWFAEEISDILVRIATVGVGGAFLLGVIPPLIWPTSSRLLSLAFPLPAVLFTSVTVLSVFGRQGPTAFLFWGSCAIAMVGSAMLAGYLGRFWGRGRHGLCQRCGYDLHTTPSAFCPECGRVLTNKTAV